MTTYLAAALSLRVLDALHDHPGPTVRQHEGTRVLDITSLMPPPDTACDEFRFVPYGYDMALNQTKRTITRAGYVWRGLGCLAIAIGGVVLGSTGYAHHNDVVARLGTFPAAFGVVLSVAMFARAVRTGRGTPGD
jgi:hypothetical protein